MPYDDIVSKELAAQVLAWQQQLHACAEVGYDEHETTRLLAEALAGMEGMEVSRPTETGLVALLRGAKPGRTVAYRADIDALPIEEDAAHACRSNNPGVMHACGHDGHMAMALGAAAWFSARRQQLAGSIKFIFQHAEETPPGGAQEMIRHGVLEGVSAITGCHIESRGESGKVYILPGPMLAATNTFSIEVLGRGGHAASPHQAVDPVLAGAHMVAALQAVISRRRNPLHRLVLSVTQFHAGTKDNIIPQTASLGGTVRILDPGPAPGYAELVPQWMEETIRGVAEAFGAGYRFTYEADYAGLVNDARVAALVQKAAAGVVGEENVLPGEANMAGDDMGRYLQQVPGCYYVVGCEKACEADGVVYPNHHPKFELDPACLPVGTAVAVRTLLALLETDF